MTEFSTGYPNAQKRIEAGLSEPNMQSLSQEWNPHRRLSKTEQKGLVAAKSSIRLTQIKEQPKVARHMEIISIEERIKRDPRGLVPVTIIGESVFIEKV